MPPNEHLPLIRLHEETTTQPRATGTGTCNSGIIQSVVHYTKAFLVGVLTFLVAILFVQVQYLVVEVEHEKEKLNELSQDESSKINDIAKRVEHEHSLAVYQMAGMFVLLTGLLTMFHMTSHLRHFRQPAVQRKVISILWLPPIYGATSFLGLILPATDAYLAVIRDFYEAYVVYNFLSFLVAVLGRGDREVVVELLAKRVGSLKPPLLQVLRQWQSSSSTISYNNTEKARVVLLECQILCMQFVFCKPMTSICNFVVAAMAAPQSSDDAKHEPRWNYLVSPGFFIALVANLSVFLAFVGLLKFYHAVKDDLAWCQPFAKFLSIKCVVFLTFWQGLLISVLASVNSTDSSSDSSTVSANPAVQIQNVLICVEMLFFAIAHWCVFPSDEWQEGYRPREFSNLGFGFQDFAKDVNTVLKSSGSASKNSEKNGN